MPRNTAAQAEAVAAVAGRTRVDLPRRASRRSALRMLDTHQAEDKVIRMRQDGVQIGLVEERIDSGPS